VQCYISFEIVVDLLYTYYGLHVVLSALHFLPMNVSTVSGYNLFFFIW